jgi:hypothetical protein
MNIEIKKKKARKKSIQKAHKEELRSRDRRNIIWIILACCLFMYCVCALMIRGFM